MKNTILLVALLLSLFTDGQLLIPYDVDSSVKVMMVDTYKVSEIRGDVTCSTTLEGGAMAVIKVAPDKGAPPVLNETDLWQRYTSFMRETEVKLGAKLRIHQKSMIGNKIIMDFILDVTSKGEPQTLYFRMCRLKTGLYVMRFSELNSASESLTRIRNSFFGSLQISDEAMALSQYEEIESNTGFRMSTSVKVLISVLLALFFTLLISLFRKKRTGNTNQ